MKKLLLIFCLLAGLSVTLQAQTYTTTTLVQGMDYPVAFDVAPDGRFFCTMKGDNQTPSSPGTAKVEVYTPAGLLLSTFCDLSDSVNSDFERGLLGITLDPNFSTNNYVYLYYNHRYNGDERIRVVRYTEANNLGTNPVLIFDLDVPNNIAGNHVGGNIHFMHNDTTHLFISIGDLAYQQTNPTLNYANKLTNPYGKHLRINKDGTVPLNNPFYDDGNPLTGNCDWIWSYGLRNSFDFCFSPVNDSMYCSENGLSSSDEVNQISPGKFYGWADCEGFFANSSTSVPCSAANAVPPIEDWNSPLPAVTGILFYSSQVMPEFDNHLLVADNDYGRIYDLTLGNAPAYDSFVSRTQWMDVVSESGGLTTIKQGTDGCIYAMKGGYTTNGKIYRICPQGLYTEESRPAVQALQLQPNPNSGITTLTFTTQSAQPVVVNITDLTGRKVAEMQVNAAAAGKQQVEITASSLGLLQGTYLVTLITAEGVSSAPMIIAE
ncbi:MAG: PQQ-dependent sugar dehydrogenase [Bacteroidia bacterium]|jgi:glucose/arabinose dehydrogenase|nr:PQQ-dependent sugar dehydrogenase [Bacteroidia bacterium]